MKSLNDKFLFYSNSCLQCKYVLEKLKSFKVNNIILVDIDDNKNNDIINKLGIKEVPTIAISDKNSIIAKRVLNTNSDIAWLLNTWLI